MAARNLAASGVIYTDQRQFYLDKEVSELWKSVAPFLTFSSKMRSKKSNDPDYKMFQHKSGWTNMRFQNTSSTNSWSGTTAGIPGETLQFTAVDNIVGLPAVDSSWLGLAGELYRDDGNDNQTLGDFVTNAVVTAQDGTYVTITSLGNPTHATYNALTSAGVANDIFVVTHSLSGEGTVAPAAASDNLEVVWNSASIIETSIEVTGTLYAAALRGYSSDLARLRNDRTMLQKMKLNNMYYFGMRPTAIGGTAYGTGSPGSTSDGTFISHISDANSKVMRSGMGIIPALKRYGRSELSHGEQNIFTLNQATYKYDHFVDDTAKIFQYVPTAGVLYGFCDMRFISFFSKVSQAGFLGNSGAKVEISDFKLDKVGLNVRDMVTPAGIIRLVYDPALKNQPKGTMVVVDPAHIGQVIYRKTRIKFNVLTDDDFDGVKDNIRSDEGPWLDLIQKHSYWTLT